MIYVIVKIFAFSTLLIDNLNFTIFQYFCAVKLLCLLLSFYVMLLSLKPCCSDNDCRDNKDVSKKELSRNASSKEKECQGCSPFFTCGSCVGFILAKPFTSSLKPIAETPAKIYGAYQQPYVQQVSLSIWQPPKLG